MPVMALQLPNLDMMIISGLDVKGKIILIEREAPVSPDAGAEKFNPWSYLFFSSVET